MKGWTENSRMSSFPAQPKVFDSSRITKTVQRVLLAVLMTVCSSALAHATLVLGTLATTPSPVRADAPFVLTLTLLDLTQIPVEDARVLAEFRRPGLDRPFAVRFQESDTPGIYQARLALPRTGPYTLLLRDQTYRREEAQATLTFPVGHAPAEPLEFVFPPTSTGAGVWTWIGFLIGLPLLAAGVVTALVRFRSSPEEGERGKSSAAPRTHG